MIPTLLARWVRRCVVPSALALALLSTLSASTASAHASLISTDPGDGAVVASSPASITLRFSEPVSIPDDTVKILDATGAVVASDTVARDATVVITPREPLADGTSIVSWRVTSLDSHPIAGGFSFSVGAPSETTIAIPSSDADPYVELLRQVGEGARYAFTLAAAGLVLFGLVIAAEARRRSVGLRRLLRRWTIGLSAVAGVLALAMIPLAQLWQDGRSLGSLADAGVWRDALTGDNALATGISMAGLAVAVAAGLRGSVTVSAVAGTVAVGSFAVVGHTRTYGTSWLVAGADVVHLAAGALWLGGLVGLCLVLVPRGDLRNADAARAVARFSAMALWTIAALAVAGGLLWWQIPHSVTTLSTSPYGRLLAVKVVLVAVVVTIAAWNRRHLVPPIRENRGRAFHLGELRRTVSFEASLIVAVLVVTGIMVTKSPRDVAAAPVAAPAAKRLDARLGDARVTARLTPGRIGVNALELSIADAAGAPVTPLETPTLTVAQDAFDLGPFAHPLSAVAPGQYEATVDLPIEGTWSIRLTARLSKFEKPVALMTVEVR